MLYTRNNVPRMRQYESHQVSIPLFRRHKRLEWRPGSTHPVATVQAAGSPGKPPGTQADAVAVELWGEGTAGGEGSPVWGLLPPPIVRDQNLARSSHNE